MNTVQKVKKAVIPVAGLGTRLLPATKAIPKEMLPLVDKPVIQHIVEEAVASGLEEIIFITSDNKIAIEQHFSQDITLENFLKDRKKDEALAHVQRPATLATFVFIPQLEPLGLGHAVLQAKDVIGDEPFVVFGGDDVVEGKMPAAKQLIETYEKHNCSVIGVMEVPPEAVSRYGIVNPVEKFDDRSMRIQDIVEKPRPEDAPSLFGVGGRWLFTPDIFTYLEQTAPDKSGEIQLTDAIRALVKHAPVFAKAYEGIYRDCGNKIEYIKAVIAFALQDPEIAGDIKTFIKEYTPHA